jgi:hypothetical protein
MATAPTTSDLAAAAKAMLAAAIKTATPAQIRQTLRTKCPRFVPNPAPILPFLDARAQQRLMIAGLPAWIEAFTTDGGVSYEFRKASAAQDVSVAA